MITQNARPWSLASQLTILPTPSIRRVFFSFHYQRDIFRVNVVRNHWLTRENHQAAGYFDGSLWEKSRTDGSAAVKRLIDDGLRGSSVTCVLLGYETYNRHWVAYEIFRSVALGKGIFGVKIHSIKDINQQQDPFAENVFDFLGVAPGPDALLVPHKRIGGIWQEFTDCPPFPASSAPYLAPNLAASLSQKFTVYDWVANNGYVNFSSWVEQAAMQARR